MLFFSRHTKCKRDTHVEINAVMTFDCTYSPYLCCQDLLFICWTHLESQWGKLTVSQTGALPSKVIISDSFQGE